MDFRQEIVRPGSGCFARALYFTFVGWWFSFIWINAAWALNASIIGLPLGLWMLNRTPQILTLKSTPVLVVHTEDGQLVQVSNLPQTGCLVRAVYFGLIGWWFSFIWINLGWFFMVTIVGLPLGLWMLNRLPAVTTLYRQ
ncbi:MAG: YccF domain-containing protein [Anaerolineae bacterium]|nr:YccF domain-containing protein [Anaerolineae bacterium]